MKNDDSFPSFDLIAFVWKEQSTLEDIEAALERRKQDWKKAGEVESLLCSTLGQSAAEPWSRRPTISWDCEKTTRLLLWREKRAWSGAVEEEGLSQDV